MHVPVLECLARRAHGLLGHLALVHVAWGLVVVGVRRERCHDGEHGARRQLLVREA